MLGNAGVAQSGYAWSLSSLAPVATGLSTWLEERTGSLPWLVVASLTLDA